MTTETAVVITGPGVPPQPTPTKKVPDLTDEEYFRLYPQMKGVPRYLKPLPPEIVNDLFAHRRKVNRTGNGSDEEITTSQLIKKVEYIKRREEEDRKYRGKKYQETL